MGRVESVGCGKLLTVAWAIECSGHYVHEESIRDFSDSRGSNGSSASRIHLGAFHLGHTCMWTCVHPCIQNACTYVHTSGCARIHVYARTSTTHTGVHGPVHIKLTHTHVHIHTRARTRPRTYYKYIWITPIHIRCADRDRQMDGQTGGGRDGHTGRQIARQIVR